jgi:hypothetical protein
MNDNNIPVTLQPPKPNLQGSEEIYDGLNRTDSNNPDKIHEFEHILRPLNTMNAFLQQLTPKCNIYLYNALLKWSSKGALTGRVNSYGVLLHRITIGNMAINTIKYKFHKQSAIKNWFKRLLTNIKKYPAPYDNNFRMWEYRAIAFTSYLTYTPFNQLQNQIDTFLRTYISNNILVCELRGMKSLEYHSYFLFPMMDALFLIRYGYRWIPSQSYAIEQVLQMIESKDYSQLEFLTGKPQLPLNDIQITTHRKRWDCLYFGEYCETAFTPLFQIVASRNA